MLSHILVIDDDPGVRAVIVSTLTRLGYQVQSAEGGRSSLALFAAEPADLVITDIFMADMDGIEVIQQLRRSAYPPKILAISGGGSICSTDALRLAREMGADATMVKPLTMSALAATARRLLDNMESETATEGHRRSNVVLDAGPT